MGIISTRRFEQNGSDGSEWAVSSGGEHYLDTVGVTSSNLVSPTICGHGSVGRAQPCQGWGRGFEPRCPLQISQPLIRGAFSYCQLLDRTNSWMKLFRTYVFFSLPKTEALLFSFSVYCLRRLTYDAFRCDCVASPAFDDYLLSLRSRSVYGRFFR